MIRALAATVAAACATVTLTAPQASAACTASPVVVVGSSTAAGAGASTYANSWAGQEAAHLATRGVTLRNLAAGGYTTYQAVPTGRWHPANRPAPDPARNITAALALRPAAVIVNLPTNDIANGFGVSEVRTNLAYIRQAATAAGVPIWITTAQPRNLDDAGRQKLAEITGWTKTTYNVRSLDFWTDLANADGTIRADVSAGDGIHINNVGHERLYQRVAESGIDGQLCAA